MWVDSKKPLPYLWDKYCILYHWNEDPFRTVYVRWQHYRNIYENMELAKKHMTLSTQKTTRNLENMELAQETHDSVNALK